MNKEVNPMEGRILAWMKHVLATGGIERFDDLHIDVIDAAFKDRTQWIRGMTESLRAAHPIRQAIAPDKVLALISSLQDGPMKTPLNTEELALQFDWSPPSLYLLHAGTEPWKKTPRISTFKKLPLAGFHGLQASELFLQEWREGDDIRRSFIAL